MNPPMQAAADQVTVTRTDMLAQIGALTLEITVLKNQLGQAQQFIQKLLAVGDAQRDAEDALADAGLRPEGAEPETKEVLRDPTPIRSEEAD
jgi:hypothetical protein